MRQPTPQTVSALTLDEVRRFHASTFRPDLTTIVVTGDVTATEARDVVEHWFGQWTATGVTPELGNHVLGGGFYATRLYHDLRQEAGYPAQP